MQKSYLQSKTACVIFLPPEVLSSAGMPFIDVLLFDLI